MKLQHNLGGLEGLGPIEPEKQVFVEPWEKRIFGIHVAMMGLSNHLEQSLPQYQISQVPTEFNSEWTWADLRKGAEAMNPFDYFKYRYYEKWLGGISGFFVEQGYISAQELDAKTQEYLQSDDSLPPKGNSAINEQVIKYLRKGDSPKRDVHTQPKFKAGEKVNIKNVHPIDHTRLPGYLRNKTGVVDLVYEGAYTYFCSTGPDGLGKPMPVYSVRFDPKDIWEEMSEGNAWVYADLFETYLEAV